MDIFLIIIGLLFLIVGGNWLLKAAVGLSLRLQIPKIVIGLTIVSLATSAPELIVSIKSALDGHADLALGNVIGSNIANLGLVLAITVLLSPIVVEKSFYKIDWPVMGVASILLYLFIKIDGVLVRYEGILLVVFLVAFLVYLLKFKKPEKEEIENDVQVVSIYKIAFFLIIGGVGLWGGSELLIKGAVGLAKSFGVSERIIAVTVVSVGTSIPELAASIIAVLKKEKAISLGNLIGSNIFNILAVLGVTSIITEVKVKDLGLLNNDIYWMLGISFILLPLVFLPKKMHLGRREGAFLLLGYVVFVYITIT